MSKERTVITQKLCDHVKALLAGKLTHKQAAEFIGIGKATVDRIVAAGFNAEQYAKNTAARKEEKKAALVGNYFTKDVTKFMPPTAEQLAAAMAPGAGQIPGQMEMQLNTMDDGSVKAEMKIPLQEVIDEVVRNRINGLMRFQAEKHDETIKELDSVHSAVNVAGYEIKKYIGALDNTLREIKDYLAQILRRMDK